MRKERVEGRGEEEGKAGGIREILRGLAEEERGTLSRHKRGQAPEVQRWNRQELRFCCDFIQRQIRWAGTCPQSPSLSQRGRRGGSRPRSSRLLWLHQTLL